VSRPSVSTTAPQSIEIAVVAAEQLEDAGSRPRPAMPRRGHHGQPEEQTRPLTRRDGQRNWTCTIGWARRTPLGERTTQEMQKPGYAMQNSSGKLVTSPSIAKNGELEVKNQDAVSNPCPNGLSRHQTWTMSPLQWINRITASARR